MPDYIKQMRKKVGTDRILLTGAAAIIVNDKGEVLFQERTGENNWGVPGGFMEPGETMLQCLTREVLEETGLLVSSPTLFGIYSGPNYAGSYKNGDKIQSVPVIFLVNKFSGKLSQDEESVTLKFFPVSDFPKPINAHHVEYLEHYKEYVQGRRKIPIIT